jgi:hypothetical protein
MVILTLIERETLQIVFTYFRDAQCVSWGFVNDTVFVSPLPANLQDLRNRITAAVARVDRDNADTRVERDGLLHKCLPYYQRWTH